MKGSKKEEIEMTKAWRNVACILIVAAIVLITSTYYILYIPYD